MMSTFLSRVLLVWIEFYPETSCLTKAKEPSLPYSLSVAGEEWSDGHKHEVKRKQPQLVFELGPLIRFPYNDNRYAKCD